MMTMDDAFDTKLRAAFTEVDSQIAPAEELVRRVMQQCHKANQRRWILLTGAAVVGCFITIVQLQKLVKSIHFETGFYAEIFAIIPADNLVSLAMVAMMTCFGFVLSTNHR